MTTRRSSDLSCSHEDTAVPFPRFRIDDVSDDDDDDVAVRPRGEIDDDENDENDENDAAVAHAATAMAAGEGMVEPRALGGVQELRLRYIQIQVHNF